MKNNNEHFELSPLEEYNAPAYPTRVETSSVNLKKLPARWAKNAAAVVCIGAMSLSALIGCATQFEIQPPARCDDGHHGVAAYLQNYNQNAQGEREFDVITVYLHGGGSGAMPTYVAQLTEQEALGIISNRLCEAGICFGSPATRYEVSLRVRPYYERRPRTVTVGLSLFDERTRQGIVFPFRWSWEFNMSRSEAVEKIEQEFMDRYGISVHFMHNTSEFLGEFGIDWDWGEDVTFTNEELQAAGKKLNERFLNNADELIERLQAEGVLLSDEDVD
ncbi:MAG: hypothetical protein FWD05_07975 [Oscillospiraceae bacterium]|nr:hypothetical protein [Oscillospiraceae bacterium]